MHYDPDGLPTREDAEVYLAERRKSTTIVKEQGTNAENIFQATKKVEDRPKEKVEDEPR